METISTKINLFFDKLVDEEFDIKVQGRSTVIRLYIRIRFKNKDNKYTKPIPAIIDSGAFISVIPLHIWSLCNPKVITNHEMTGLIPKDECKLPVLVGEIKGILVDQDNMSDEYKFISYLALTDKIPVILGFRELLEKFKICFDYQEKIGFIELKEV